MHFLHEKLIQEALKQFRACGFENPNDGDDFNAFAPGSTTDYPDHPYERFRDYEELLLRLMNTDKEKYRKMHKGTPFGFLSWLAFDMRNYVGAWSWDGAGRTTRRSHRTRPR